LNIETESVIRLQLASEERLLWNGRPPQGFVFRGVDAFMIPFSLLWGGFALFWEYSVISTDKASLFFMLWGIPFVAIGLHFIFGRFLVDAKQRANTSYGVTNQRVIIVSGILSKKIKSLNLRSLSDLSLDEKSNGSGIISFGASSFPTWLSSGFAWPGMPSPLLTFELTENARTVFEIIRKAQGSAT
jgi:hypothetical protein